MVVFLLIFSLNKYIIVSMRKRILCTLILVLSAGFAVPAARAKLVACIGDSITYGAGIGDRINDSYPAQLGRMLREYDPQWQTQNFGVSGATLLRHGDLPYTQQSAYSQALNSNPDVIVIMLGTNDSKSFNWVYKDEFVSDYLYLIDSFAELPSHPDIWICQPVPAFSGSFSISDSVIHEEIIPLIDQIAQQRNVRVIDLYTLLTGASDLFPDGIHPNIEGAGLIAEAIVPFLIGMRALPDFDGNAWIDFRDFNVLARYWLQNEPSLDIVPPPDGDGVVDYRELAALAEFWLRQIGLVSYWKLDETEGTVAFDSAGQNNADVLGGAQWRSKGGMVDGAIELDGLDDCLRTPFVICPSPEQFFSVFAWIKGGATGQVIVSQPNAQNWIMIDPAQGRLASELFSGRGASALISDTVITDGGWHRIGLTWDGSRKVLYVDDAEVASDTTIGTGNSQTGLYIGAGKSRNPGSFFSGLIDDVKIYNRPVTP
jgi:lysophospholipase L1-like esterase